MPSARERRRKITAPTEQSNCYCILQILPCCHPVRPSGQTKNTAHTNFVHFRQPPRCATGRNSSSGLLLDRPDEWRRDPSHINDYCRHSCQCTPSTEVE